VENMKRKIDVLEYSGKIMKALSKGVLLTVKGQNNFNIWKKWDRKEYYCERN